MTGKGLSEISNCPALCKMPKMRILKDKNKTKQIYDCHIANSHKRVEYTKNSFDGSKVTKLNIKDNWKKIMYN